MKYLTLAEYLTGYTEMEPGEEAIYRAAISRAYYSVFCYSRNYLLKNGLLTEEDLRRRGELEGSHRIVINVYLFGESRQLKKIGSDLNKLRRYRVKADYDDVYENFKNDLETALSTAKKVFERFSRLD